MAMKFMAEQFELNFAGEDPDPQYKIYTDGSCLINPDGPGGWCAIILKNGTQHALHRGYLPSTTNNRAELIAAINGLANIPSKSKCVVVTDSKYVQLGAMHWRKSWQRKKFKNIKNPDLWQELSRLIDERRCKFEWVRGHNGDEYNEKCDKYAVECARKEVLEEEMT